MTEKLITLVATPNDSYGVLFVSETVHRVTGPGVHGDSSPLSNRGSGYVHNPSFNHRLDVWTNVYRLNTEPDKWTEACGKPGPGKYLDPHRKGTDEPFSFLLSAQATMISREPYDGPTQGQTLAIGDTVRLEYPAEGDPTSDEFWLPAMISQPYRIVAGSFSDPFLVPIN